MRFGYIARGLAIAAVVFSFLIFSQWGGREPTEVLEWQATITDVKTVNQNYGGRFGGSTRQETYLHVQLADDRVIVRRVPDNWQALHPEAPMLKSGLEVLVIEETYASGEPSLILDLRSLYDP